MIEQLRKTCRELLEQGDVKVVIGYGQSAVDGATHPVFITEADDVDQLVFNDRCYANLTTYLSRKEVRALGKPAIVVKGCDEKTLIQLENESQIDRQTMVVIGVACPGVTQPLAERCDTCDVHMPSTADVVLGETQVDHAASKDERYAELDRLMALSHEERQAYWQEQFARCVKCYACRQVCPLCYCERCVADKNRPTRINTSATVKGNLAWHVARAFHLAGRCVGCGQCTRACPAGIRLDLLNLSLARAADENFDFCAGTTRGAEPLIGTFSENDHESFIQ